MIATLSAQLATANKRVAELEEMVEHLNEELDSFREHEDVAVSSEAASSQASEPDSFVALMALAEEDGEAANAAIQDWLEDQSEVEVMEYS